MHWQQHPVWRPTDRHLWMSSNFEANSVSRSHANSLRYKRNTRQYEEQETPETTDHGVQLSFNTVITRRRDLSSLSVWQGTPGRHFATSLISHAHLTYKPRLLFWSGLIFSHTLALLSLVHFMLFVPVVNAVNFQLKFCYSHYSILIRVSVVLTHTGIPSDYMC